MAAKLVPEAAKRYAALVGEIRTIEHEISDPRYQNRLASCQADLTQLKETLKNHRAEKESLLEKAARGRQILLGNHFTDEASIQNQLRRTQEAYKEYREKTAESGGRFQTAATVLCFLASGILALGMGFCIKKPDTIRGLLVRFGPEHAGTSPSFFTFLTVLCGLGGAVFLAAALTQLRNRRRLKQELSSVTGFLCGILKEHLGESTISDEFISRLEQHISELLRLERAVCQSEQALKRLTGEIEQLQSRETELSKEIETGQRLQWELEQKLERLSVCRSESESLRHVLTENERIQEELDALDLAQDTLTRLSSTIRDSFGLYLNKTASELINGITGGIYTSMSIDQDLNIFMNTPSRLVPAEQVSSGTIDQIYLAVRLAAAKLVQTEGEQMPLIFDDSFALYDDERLKTALKWLSKAFKGQIILFTCHQREAQLLTANQIDFHYLTL